jgi:antitoxin component YwqK of YwqJK toxin-antitoxin module
VPVTYTGVSGYSKKTSMKHIIIILSLLFFFSCGQTEVKKIVSKHKNGEPHIVNYYSDNDDTLSYRKEVFYESGKQEYIGHIINRTKEGVWTWWYENENKKDQCKYVNGIETDTIFHWYKNGKIKQLDILLQGKSNSENPCTVCCNIATTKYYDNGKTKEKYTVVDDKFQGTFVSYKENGSWYLKNYKNNSLWGATTEHLIDSNETIIVVGQYEDGKEIGNWKWFDKDSSLTQTVTYIDGITNGEYIKFFKNGQKKLKGELLDGVYQDSVFYFNEMGKLEKLEYYKKGKLQRTIKK